MIIRGFESISDSVSHGAAEFMKSHIILSFLILLAVSSCCSVPRDTDYPPEPNFEKLSVFSDRDYLFGHMEYEPWWGKGKIMITNDWENQHLERTFIPQLKGIRDYNDDELSGFIRVNRNIERQYKMLWHAWEKAGLLKLVHSWGGGYSTRKVTGSYLFLSNHAYGTAFDINTAENHWNTEPARRSKKGSVYDLVTIAHEHGFYWGGHFCKLDGMHFEVSVILSDVEIQKLTKKYGFVSLE